MVKISGVAIFGNGTNSTSGIATLFVLDMDKGIDGWQSGDFVKNFNRLWRPPSR